LTLLCPELAVEIDDITVEFGDAEEIDLRVDNRVHALQVPRVDGRNPDTLKINRRTGVCRWFQRGALAVRSVIPREMSGLLLAESVSPRTTDWYGLPRQPDRLAEITAWDEAPRIGGNFLAVGVPKIEGRTHRLLLDGAGDPALVDGTEEIRERVDVRHGERDPRAGHRPRRVAAGAGGRRLAGADGGLPRRGRVRAGEAAMNDLGRRQRPGPVHHRAHVPVHAAPRPRTPRRCAWPRSAPSTNAGRASGWPASGTFRPEGPGRRPRSPPW
jgi:hypothetical protein